MSTAIRERGGLGTEERNNIRSNCLHCSEYTHAVQKFKEACMLSEHVCHTT